MTEPRRDAPSGGAPSTGRGDAVRAAAASPRPRRRSQRSAVVAYGGSAVAFAAVLGALSWQVGAGQDPALGSGEPAASAPPPKRVLVRRIVRRVVTTRGEPAAPAAAPAPASGGVPASAPAAPPAPAPAPPTTRSS